MELGPNRYVKCRFLGEEPIRGRYNTMKKVGAPSERTKDELWNDLDNWRRHVDPEVFSELEHKYHVNLTVLDEVFCTVQYKNLTFGPRDQGIRGERLQDDVAPGSDFRDIVQEYVDTLRECGATCYRESISHRSQI